MKTRTIIRQARHWLDQFDKAQAGTAKTRYGQDSVANNASKALASLMEQLNENAESGDTYAQMQASRLAVQLSSRGIL